VSGRGPSLADVLSHVDEAGLIELARDLVRTSQLIEAAKMYVASALNFLEP
jgi:hypothetical protein